MYNIAIEGVSGSGKSEFAKEFALHIHNSGITILHTSGMQESDLHNPVQEFVRQKYLISDRFIRAPYWVETMLLLATAKMNDYLSSLERRDVFIRENYIHGFRAYQCSRAREEGVPAANMDSRLAAVAASVNVRWPDLVIWICSSVETIVERLNRRTRDSNLTLGEAEVNLLRSVNSGYENILLDRPNVLRINNDSSLEALKGYAREAASEVLRRLQQPKPKGRIYIAGPLFTPGERQYLENIAMQAEMRGFQTYLPHRDGGLATYEHTGNSYDFFISDYEAICWSDGILAVLNGSDVDSGTAWEIGMAFSLGKPVVGVYEDSRGARQNLMIANSIVIRDGIEEALNKIQEILFVGI